MGQSLFALYQAEIQLYKANKEMKSPRPGMLSHTCNPSTWQAKAGGWAVLSLS